MISNMSAQDFQCIYDKYKNLLFRIAFTYIKNSEDAEDILQEVFIKRIYGSPVFDSEEHEKRWMIRIAVNLSKNHVKSFWYRNKIQIDELSELSEISQWELNSEEQMVFSEVMSLPKKQRVAIYLHYFEGYTCKEIADMTGSRESAVKMRLKKGRELLKNSLED